MVDLSAVGRVVEVVVVFVVEVVVVDVAVVVGHESLALAQFGRHAAVGGLAVAGAEQLGNCSFSYPICWCREWWAAKAWPAGSC